ncbi:hypothetical protein LOD99_6362 [Oopsacas minuta]|uniref:N-acetylgalactosaminide beta-1,3-galactosyltransferase n=1 Tax=Oopsacas minuta TaxID=111878 RepID=A0AAV7JMF5_9METZ|nr:hypothetical protein LOD99_6362 [Oopsacas minuta]
MHNSASIQARFKTSTVWGRSHTVEKSPFAYSQIQDSDRRLQLSNILQSKFFSLILSSGRENYLGKMNKQGEFFPKLLLFFFYLISLIVFLSIYMFPSTSNLQFSEISFESMYSTYIQEYVINATAEIMDNKSAPRILCWVCTYPDSSNSVFKSYELWGQYLDKTIYVSNNISLLQPLSALHFPVDHETRSQLWKKTMFSFIYLLNNFGTHFDWFMKADDDTFVVPNNLYKFLANYNSSEPHYFGRELVLNGVIYCSGGGGYIISRTALEIFVKGLDSVCKDQKFGVVEDYEFGRCLNRLGIYPEDSRDKFGRYRFNHLSLRYHLLTPKGQLPEWVYTMSKYPIIEGKNCCAADVITFHYMNEEDSLELYKLLLEPPKNLINPSKLYNFFSIE